MLKLCAIWNDVCATYCPESCASMYVGTEDGGIEGRRGNSTPDVFYALPFDLYKEALRCGVVALFIFPLVAHLTEFGKILTACGLTTLPGFTLPYCISNKYWLDGNASQCIPLPSIPNTKSQITKGHRVQFPFCEHEKSCCKSKLKINDPVILPRAW